MSMIFNHWFEDDNANVSKADLRRIENSNYNKGFADADEKRISILKEVREKIIDSYKHKGGKDLTLVELMDIFDEYLPEKETIKWQMQNCCCIWDKETKI